MMNPREKIKKYTTIFLIITSLAVTIGISYWLIKTNTPHESYPHQSSTGTILDFYSADLSLDTRTRIIKLMKDLTIKVDSSNFTIRKDSFKKDIETKPQYGKPTKDINFIIDINNPRVSFLVNHEVAINNDIDIIRYSFPLISCIESPSANNEATCENMLHGSDGSHW